jgi:outer membrane protein insertion porin family
MGKGRKKTVSRKGAKSLRAQSDHVTPYPLSFTLYPLIGSLLPRSRFPIFPLALFSLLILSAFFPARLPAQQARQPASYEGEKVAFVDLVVRPGMDVEALRSLILQKAGEPYSNEKVQSSIATLKQTGRFSKVDIEVIPEAGGLRVAFVAQPAFYIGMIYFPGAVRVFSYPRLLQAVNYPAQEPYEASRVKDAELALRRFFSDNGYFTAQVQSETKLDEAHLLADLVFHVTLNKRAKFGRVEVTGPPREEAGRVEHALSSLRARLKGASLKSGKPYDPKRLEAATSFIRNYMGRENRLASQVRLQQPQYDPETNRANVAFQVTLGPTAAVRVAGARLSKRNMRKLIPIYEENAFDQDLVAEGQRNLVSYFQSKGYFDVKVNPQVQDEPSQVSVVYRIDKGSKHRVMSVRTAGNRKFDEDDLKDQIVVEKGRFLSRGKFSQDRVNRSVDNLTAFYRDAGFADVKVQPDVVDREPKVYVTFKITEGEATLVDSLQTEGNKTQTVAALAPDGLKLKPGQPYSRSRLDQDRNQIVANYMNLGYLSVDLKSTAKALPGNPHRVAVTYVIQEGPQAKISDVAYVGGQHTRQSFIQHNTSVSPGAPLSEGKLLGSESSLYNLGIFDWANVSPRRPITDQKQEEVLVKVHEAKRNSLSYGLGFQSSPRSGSLSAGIVALPGLPTVGLPARFQIIEKNIISPLGSVEYSRLNLLGRAETASIATVLSRLDQKASFTYTDPQFRGLDWSALWSLSVERTTQNPLFTARLGSGSFQVEKALDAAKTKRLQFRYTFQRTTLTDLLIHNFVLPQDTNIRSSTLSTSFLRDTRDKPLDAHRGVFQTLDFGVSPKAIGSTDNVVRFFGQSAFYREVKPWMVWANNFRLGLIKAFGGSHVPISEQFFSGGSDSLRGFPLNGAGPQALAVLCTTSAAVVNSQGKCSIGPTFDTTVPVGGRQLFIFNSEGRFPIPLKKDLGGVIFYDGGNVYRAINISHFFSCGGAGVQPGCGYSNTVGVGLRYQTPVGPVRVDIGRNLNPVPGLKTTNIFVTLGQSF